MAIAPSISTARAAPATRRTRHDGPSFPDGRGWPGGRAGAGRGTFADYDGKAETTGSGEILAGLEVPLLRGRAIDGRRAGTATAELGVERASRQLDAVRLGHLTAALSSYWDWVTAGRQLAVARALLTLAEVRDTQLVDAVALGQIAAIERTDNLRAIF